jgi:hypothetical protein
VRIPNVEFLFQHGLILLLENRVLFFSRFLFIYLSFAVIKPDIQRREPSRLEEILKETPSPQLRGPSQEPSRETSPQTSSYETSNCDENDDQITMQLEMKRFVLGRVCHFVLGGDEVVFVLLLI